MTILSVVRQVCSVVGVIVPQSFFAQINTNRTMQEMLECANEMAQRIAYDTRDWTALRNFATYVGDGSKTAWEIPSDFKRMLLDGGVWRSTSTEWPMRFIADHNEWRQRRLANRTDGRGEWTMIGGKMHIYPPLRALIPADPGPPIVAEVPAETAYYDYVDKNCVALNSGGIGNVFMNDADIYRLDERLLKLGMIFDWKMKKGSPYAEDMSTYQDALAMDQGHDQPAPILMGSTPISSWARVAYPWPPGWGPQ